MPGPVKADPLQSAPIRHVTWMLTFALGFFASGTRARSETELDSTAMAIGLSESRSITISAKRMGALGDGQVATDCTMHAGSNRLICQSHHFNPADSGKVIAVYGAGPSTGNFIQPLSSR